MATATKRGVNRLTEIGGEAPTNWAAAVLEMSQPYFATVRLRGVADLLFHRWNCEAVEARANAAKGSKAKKTDDIESYVYRNDAGELCIPGEYPRQALLMAAKFRQDRVTIQKASVTRVRPAMKAGWEAEFQFLVNLPEYVPQDVLHETLASAGKLVGLGDFRPTYGRFAVTSIQVGQ